MYDAHVTKMPASWAEVDAVPDGEYATNGNGLVNGNMANGHSNGHTAGTDHLPKSFLDGKAVRTVYGLVPLKYALDWPVFASYDELAGCASWMGGRIPTADEARSIYAHVNIAKKAEAERKLGKTVPAVNG